MWGKGRGNGSARPAGSGHRLRGHQLPSPACHPPCQPPDGPLQSPSNAMAVQVVDVSNAPSPGSSPTRPSGLPGPATALVGSSSGSWVSGSTGCLAESPSVRWKEIVPAVFVFDIGGRSRAKYACGYNIRAVPRYHMLARRSGSLSNRQAAKLATATVPACNRLLSTRGSGD